MRFSRRSAEAGLTGGPIRDLADDCAPDILGIHGGDLAALRPVVAVAEGQRVAAGQRLLSDRKRPWITVVAPVSGRVSRLEPGPRRGVSALEIEPAGDEAAGFDIPGVPTREGLIRLMVEAGLWAGMRARPFGRVADPARPPDALFVTAMESTPGAPDASAVIGEFSEWFRLGLAALPVLSDGPVWLCHAPGMAVAEVEGVTARAFGGPHPAGLAGTHIHRLHPVAHGGMVWQIAWQEVIALGCLLQTGRIWQRRVVSVWGPAVASPGLVAAPLGARLHDIARGRLADVPLRLLAGGLDAGLALPYLRRSVVQVTALPHRDVPRPGPLRRLMAPARPAFIPNAWDEAAAPPGVLPVALLRALASGDAGAARDLGVLGLLEEDLAALNARLGGNRGGTDYTDLLRQTLNELEALA